MTFQTRAKLRIENHVSYWPKETQESGCKRPRCKMHMLKMHLPSR